MNSKDIKYLDWITLAIVALVVIATDAPVGESAAATPVAQEQNQ